MRIITYIVLLIVILIGITFAILNPVDVTIHYYIGHRTLPLSLLLVAAFAIGSLLGLFVGFWLLVKIKIKNYRLRQRLKVAEKEIENLRAIPSREKY